MKVAKVQVEAVSLSCPECGEDIPAPVGSLLWLPNGGEQYEKTIECDVCKAVVRLPGILKNAIRRAS